MRHTAFLVLGEDSSNISADIKKYVLMHGKGGAADYFKVYNWNASNGVHQVSAFTNQISANAGFCSGLENEFNVMPQSAKELKTEEEVEHFFSVLYNETVTISMPGDSKSLHLFILLPLYKPELWVETKLIMECINNIQQSYCVDIVGLSDDMALLLSNEKEREVVPKEYKKLKNNTAEVCDQIVKYKGKCKHRFVLMQNRTTNGVGLNLDHESLIGILGEFALICVENYTSIFPVYEECEYCDVNSIGLSVLNIDEYYFVHYLLRKAYLSVLSRENVIQTTVDVNKVSLIAQQSLKGEVDLFSNFYKAEVEKLIQQGKSKDQIITDITPLLKDKFAQLAKNIQSFIGRTDLSLPEKQAVLAQILGEDDSLLKGYQYNTKQLIIEDCDKEAVDLFVNENNKLIKRKYDEKGRVTIEPSVLKSPCRDNGDVYLPIEELKELRAKIRESTNYIRVKSKELEDLKERSQNVEKSKIRLTKDGFTYGNVTYKFLKVKEELLQEDYKANVSPKRSVDLRNMFPRVKDQGELGTCSVFTLVSIYEYILNKTERKNDLSERFVYYNVLNDSGNLEDSGASLRAVIESIVKYGACEENLCRYDVNLYKDKPSDAAYENAKSHRISCAKNVQINHNDITSALTEGFPVAISLKIYESFGENVKGFVRRPSDEEIKSGEYGNHAMVICGYSSEEKFYIVRNSWGDRFGDKGYCYIPFSYIEDSTLTNSACIITTINEGEDVKGIIQPIDVVFNKTDIDIKYSIVSNLIEEEKIDVAKNKVKYENLRFGYETLIQNLSNNGTRKEIVEKSKQRLQSEIEENKKEYISFKNAKRPKELSEHKKETNKLVIILSIVSFIFLVIAVLGIWKMESPFTFTHIPVWVWGVGGLSLLGLGFIAFYIPYRKHYYRVLENELEERAQLKNVNIHKKETEFDLLELRLYIAGMIIDRLVGLQKELHNKYLMMKSYVGNLSVWYEEEKEMVKNMKPLDKVPFVPLLSNDVLDAYFDREGEKLTESICLYEYFNGYELSESGIRDYKTKIKKELVAALKQPLGDFKLFSHIQKDVVYDFVKSVDITTLLPLLDSKSNCFLHTKILDVGRKNTELKSLFINVETKNEEKVWNDMYPNCFQSKPVSENCNSRLKLVVFQKASLMLDEIVI